MDKSDAEKKVKEIAPQHSTNWGTRDMELKDAVTNMQVPSKRRK